MRKIRQLLLFTSLFILVTACSNQSQKGMSEEDSASGSGQMTVAEQESDLDQEEAETESTEKPLENRMIIQKAKMRLHVKSLEEAQLNIEKKVHDYGGYIIKSNVYRENEERISGEMTVRVPEKHFQSFLTETEGEAAEVLSRNVSGDDVTEQYVDLESRLKSKQVVEERLLEFMANAEKTEDLLKISSDLAKIQEEIELIIGKMNYFENQTSYSTIEISMLENRVIVPGLDGSNLDTWEKTKKQLATSMNLLFATGSGIIVFFIGNLPIHLLLLLVGSAMYYILWRKKTNKK